MTGAYDTSAYDTCLQEYVVEGPLASAVWADPYNATGSMQMPGNKARVLLGQFNFSIPLKTVRAWPTALWPRASDHVCAGS